MRNSTICLGLLAALGCAATAWADTVINIRLSYHVVLNPANGNRPPGVTDSDIDSAIAEANQLLASFERGYRFVRVDPVTNVGGMGGNSRPNPSYYYNVDFFNVDGARDQMEADALANPGLYAWNSSAINLYMVNGICGGQCSFPNDQIIVIGGCSDATGWLHLHEIGHYFDLCHTQGCPCGCCGGGSGECNTTPGDDEISDTLPDLSCWSRDQIAQNAYGANYAALSPGQQNNVDNVWFNIMSYHGSGCGQGATPSRETERQLDHWADTATFTRTSVRDGKTLFINTSSFIIETGGSSFPFDTVAEGVSAASASGGDILMFRTGEYPDTLTISKHLTMRVTRVGAARIGVTALAGGRPPSPRTEPPGEPPPPVEPQPTPADQLPWMGFGPRRPQ